MKPTEPAAVEPETGGRYDTPEARWAGVGPYYAMFPAGFADQVVEEYTRPGDLVCDPFAGRGTAVFSAAARGRRAVGVEISPVGWVYARAKLATAPLEKVLARLPMIQELAKDHTVEAAALPEFFRWAFAPGVLAFLLAARKYLDWRRSPTDATLMALLLVDLHGKPEAALSNQMRQTKSLWPGYAVRWWRAHGLTTPPEHDPVEFLTKKARWRYARGTPRVTPGSRVLLGDNTRRLAPLLRGEARPVQLLFTSPPYLGVTNYHHDQWLRLWLLGGAPGPTGSAGQPSRGRFCNQPAYRRLLQNVFRRVSHSLSARGVVYVRTDHREPTLSVTAAVLREAFPGWNLREVRRPVLRATQTHLFGSTRASGGEVDLILTRRRAERPRVPAAAGGRSTDPDPEAAQVSAAPRET